MTERLYLIDSELSGCEAEVLACKRTEGGFAVKLSQSVFFPNKGGQPCDTGSIGGARVLSCFEEGDALYHLCERELAPGSRVKVEIDVERRMDIMRQHTGEHILSYCAWKLFQTANVGFHCALDYATLDLDKPLSQKELDAIEWAANELVYANAAVRADIYADEAEISGIQLRKHSEGITAPIRLVSIEGADVCTCCAPHVKRTGEIGQIKIVDAMAYKGGMRLTFLCGGRALRRAAEMQKAMSRLALEFSTSWDRVEAAVGKQGEELNGVRRELRSAQGELDAYRAEELKRKATEVAGVRLIVDKTTAMDGKRLRSLCQNTLEGKSLSLLFAPQNEQVNYVICCKELNLDMGGCIEAVNAALNGKGGGRGTLAQGSAKLRPGLDETLISLKNYFSRLLG
ncbi:MAG: DHHA1 domain-containing protein [Clostridia bacterium]|nr:DHHA1 domain-containing protein [Clostridia bacterium]